MPSAPVFSQEISSFCSEWFSADSQDIPSACLQWVSASAPGWKQSAKQHESCCWPAHKDKLRTVLSVHSKILNSHSWNTSLKYSCNSRISILAGQSSTQPERSNRGWWAWKSPAHTTKHSSQHLVLSNQALRLLSGTGSWATRQPPDTILLMRDTGFSTAMSSFSFDFPSLLPTFSSLPCMPLVCCN